MSTRVIGEHSFSVATLDQYARIALADGWSVLNIILASVSVFRLLVNSFSLGISAILGKFFAAYTTIFHGALDFAVSLFPFITFELPSWSKDLVIIWLVVSGAASRLINLLSQYQRFPGGQSVGTGVLAAIYRALVFYPSQYLRNASIGLRSKQPAVSSILMFVRSGLTYLTCLILFPLILAVLCRDKSMAHLESGDVVLTRTIFVLQTSAVILCMAGIAALNAASM